MRPTERPVPTCPCTSVTLPPLRSTSAASLSTSAIFSATSFPTRSRYCCRLYCPLFDSLGYSQFISRLAHWLCVTRQTDRTERDRKSKRSKAMCGQTEKGHSEVDQYDVLPEFETETIRGKSKRTCIESRVEQEEHTQSSSSGKTDKPSLVCASLKEIWHPRASMARSMRRCIELWITNPAVGSMTSWRSMAEVAVKRTRPNRSMAASATWSSKT